MEGGGGVKDTERYEKGPVRPEFKARRVRGVETMVSPRVTAVVGMGVSDLKSCVRGQWWQDGGGAGGGGAVGAVEGGRLLFW